MKREDILNGAKRCVCGGREEDYGAPEDNFGVIAELWETFLRARCMYTAELTVLPEDVAAMMALLKLARIATGAPKADSWIDLAGYAACGGEMATAEVDACNMTDK